MPRLDSCNHRRHGRNHDTPVGYCSGTEVPRGEDGTRTRNRLLAKQLHHHRAASPCAGGLQSHRLRTDSSDTGPRRGRVHVPGSPRYHCGGVSRSKYLCAARGRRCAEGAGVEPARGREARSLHSRQVPPPVGWALHGAAGTARTMGGSVWPPFAPARASCPVGDVDRVVPLPGVEPGDSGFEPDASTCWARGARARQARPTAPESGSGATQGCLTFAPTTANREPSAVTLTVPRALARDRTGTLLAEHCLLKAARLPASATRARWDRLGSNQRHPTLQIGALPTELQPLVARDAGDTRGAQRGDRTRDLTLTKGALCH